MDFDYFFNLNNVAQWPCGALLNDTRDQAVLAEKLGFTAVWTSEHHFGGECYDVQPNPILTLMCKWLRGLPRRMVGTWV